MTQPLTIGQMAPDDLVLDSHTAAFFDEQYHSGKIEHLFPLNFMKLPSLTFGGRVAPLRTGEVVAIIQERNADGTPYSGDDGGRQLCFIAEPVYNHWIGGRWILREGQFLEPQRDEFWRLFDLTNDSSSSLSRYIGFGLAFSRGRLWRCHYEENMGVACRLQASGECHIREIHPDKRPPHAQSVDVKENIDLQPLGVPADGGLDEMETTFLKLGDQDFHAWVSAKMHDPEEELFQIIRFCGQSEEDKCQEVLGCTHTVRKEAEALFRNILTLSMYEGQALAETGLLEGNTEVAWKPWAWDSLIAWYGKRIPDYISVPDTVHPERLAVLAQKRCRLPAFCTEAQTSPGGAKRLVGYKWAAQFEVEVPIVELSAHEVAVMVST